MSSRCCCISLTVTNISVLFRSLNIWANVQSHCPLERSRKFRMYHWNKIPIPPFGTRSTVYQPYHRAPKNKPQRFCTNSVIVHNDCTNSFDHTIQCCLSTAMEVRTRKRTVIVYNVHDVDTYMYTSSHIADKTYGKSLTKRRVPGPNVRHAYICTANGYMESLLIFSFEYDCFALPLSIINMYTTKETHVCHYFSLILLPLSNICSQH